MLNHFNFRDYASNRAKYIARKLFLIGSFQIAITLQNKITKKTRLLVSGQIPDCSDCLLRFIEQQ